MITRTFDYRRVKNIVEWPVVVSKDIIYLSDDDKGIWTVHDYKDGVMIHADMTLKCRGKRAVESAKNAFKWIFENTENKIIYAKISIEKPAASYIAIASGMKFTHNNNEDRFYEVRK